MNDFSCARAPLLLGPRAVTLAGLLAFMSPVASGCAGGEAVDDMPSAGSGGAAIGGRGGAGGVATGGVTGAAGASGTGGSTTGRGGATTGTGGATAGTGGATTGTGGVTAGTGGAATARRRHAAGAPRPAPAAPRRAPAAPRPVRAAPRRAPADLAPAAAAWAARIPERVAPAVDRPGRAAVLARLEAAAALPAPGAPLRAAASRPWIRKPRPRRRTCFVTSTASTARTFCRGSRRRAGRTPRGTSRSTRATWARRRRF